jgi:isopentenyldiphosphate isomerase
MELWDAYTKDRIKTGETMVRGEKQPEGWYRLVVHACVFNGKGELLVQQRQPFKDGWSNMWDITVGGSAVAGENSQEGIERELFEEVGIKHSFAGVRPVLTVNIEGGFDDIYIIEKDVDITKLKLQYEEVQAVKWASLDDIFKMIDSGEFIPYHKSLVELLFAMRERKGAHTSADKTVNTIPAT